MPILNMLSHVAAMLHSLPPTKLPEREREVPVVCRKKRGLDASIVDVIALTGLDLSY